MGLGTLALRPLMFLLQAFSNAIAFANHLDRDRRSSLDCL